MSKKEEEKIFKFIKDSLEKDFGTVPEKMVYELMIICKTFPDFLKFYLSCCGLTILEALDKYLMSFKKRKPTICKKLQIKNRKENNILYYMLLGLLFKEAYNLVGGGSNAKANIDYTDSVNELLKNRKKPWNI